MKKKASKGRPRKKKQSRAVGVSVTLYPHQIRWLKERGISRTLQALVDDAMG